jgi:hypothetical protein
MEAKCNCRHCDGPIAFDTAEAGNTITCPHCQRETLLTLPPPGAPKPPAGPPAPATIPAGPRLGWIKTILYLNLAAIISIAVFTGLTWQRTRQSPDDDLADRGLAAVVPYQYTEFEYTDTHVEDGRTVHPEIKYYDLNLAKGTSTNIDGGRINDIGELLGLISYDGWELVWTDGHRYLVKRPESQHWGHNIFNIVYNPAP